MEYKTIKEWLEAYSSETIFNDLYLIDLGWYDLFDVGSCIAFTKDIAAPLLEKLKGSYALDGLTVMFTQSQHCKGGNLFESIKFLNTDERVVFNITHDNGKWEVWDFRDNRKYAHNTKYINLVFEGGELGDVLTFFV